MLAIQWDPKTIRSDGIVLHNCNKTAIFQKGVDKTFTFVAAKRYANYCVFNLKVKGDFLGLRLILKLDLKATIVQDSE